MTDICPLPLLIEQPFQDQTKSDQTIAFSGAFFFQPCPFNIIYILFWYDGVGIQSLVRQISKIPLPSQGVPSNAGKAPKSICPGFITSLLAGDSTPPFHTNGPPRTAALHLLQSHFFPGPQIELHVDHGTPWQHHRPQDENVKRRDPLFLPVGLNSPLHEALFSNLLKNCLIETFAVKGADGQVLVIFLWPEQSVTAGMMGGETEYQLLQRERNVVWM